METEMFTSAFVLYRPTGENSEDISYTAEALQIISLSVSSTGEKSPTMPDIRGICLKWKNIFEKEIENSHIKKKGISTIHYIDVFKSGRRRYAVKGLILSNAQDISQQEHTYYMFSLERIHRDTINLPLISRQWQLNNREQELVPLLLEDLSNKEIAYRLNLSINTVKLYMKILMRKLGVNSRAGIISNLLTKKNTTS